LVKSTFTCIDLNRKPYDIVYFNWPNIDLLTKILKTEPYHNNSMILINNIHQNQENSRIWQLLKDNEKVTVSIDMFHTGALFFRKEQTKQHFKIRI